jgi:antitoxin CptB
MIGAARRLVSFYNAGMNVEHNRVYWHSRRGMLELDLILGPFARDGYTSLSAADRALYQRLLECEDQDLFGWFMGRAQPDDEELATIVQRVLEFNRPAS